MLSYSNDTLTRTNTFDGTLLVHHQRIPPETLGVIFSVGKYTPTVNRSDV